MIQAGLIKALDFGTTVGFMESGGWRLPTFAAIMVTAAETVGGVGLILGLLTPLAACAVVAAMIDAWAVNVSQARLLVGAVQRAVPARIRGNGAALHRRRVRTRVDAQGARPAALVAEDRVGTARAGRRGRGRAPGSC